MVLLGLLTIPFMLVTCSPQRRKHHRELRLLVPQLLPNYTTTPLPPAPEVSCSTAWLSCRYRGGCGHALQQYMTACTHLVTGNSSECDVNCRLALVALISTTEGERLMQCQCEDSACRQEKARVEPCRALVESQVSQDTVVTCTAATYICLAEPTCHTALHYYNTNCQQMFAGKSCNKKCKNSVDILVRQNKAKKLRDCVCDGSEKFDCQNIRTNMESLCFGEEEAEIETEMGTEMDTLIETEMEDVMETEMDTVIETDMEREEIETVEVENVSTVPVSVSGGPAKISAELVISILSSFCSSYLGHNILHLVHIFI